MKYRKDTERCKTMLFYNMKFLYSYYESIFKSLKSVCLQFWRLLKFLEEITLIRQRMSLQQNVWGKHLNWVKVLHCFCFVTFSFCSDNVCLLCASRMYFMIMETIFIGSAERPPNTLCQHGPNHETQYNLFASIIREAIPREKCSFLNIVQKAFDSPPFCLNIMWWIFLKEF